MLKLLAIPVVNSWATELEKCPQRYLKGLGLNLTENQGSDSGESEAENVRWPRRSRAERLSPHIRANALMHMVPSWSQGSSVNLSKPPASPQKIYSLGLALSLLLLEVSYRYSGPLDLRARMGC